MITLTQLFGGWKRSLLYKSLPPIHLNIVEFLPSHLGNQGCFIAFSAMRVVWVISKRTTIKIVFVSGEMSTPCLRHCSGALGLMKKIKVKCALYLLHTWIQWKEINTKPPYEFRLGWVLDKQWMPYRQLYNDRDLGHQVLMKHKLVLFERSPYITSSESFSPLCDKGLMHIHGTTE